MEAQRPAVLFLFEVLGDMAAFRVLRKRLRKAGYAAVFLAGDGIGQRDGVVLAVDSKQARVRKAWRVAERVLAAKITFKGEENDAYVAGIHGVTAETGELRAPTRFKAQLRALSAASGGGSWLTVGGPQLRAVSVVEEIASAAQLRRCGSEGVRRVGVCMLPTSERHGRT